MLEILEKAREGGYGVLASNVFNEDSVRVCTEVAVELGSHLTTDVSPDNHKGIIPSGKLICSVMNEVRIPITLNLDYRDNLEAHVKTIYSEFIGVMVDRSALSFEEDARQVAKFKNICEPLGITVEAKFGQTMDGCDYKEERDEYLTDPVKAKEFVEESGCDCLAASIGEVHREYTEEGPDIDFERLKEIKNLVDVHLVFHGGPLSGFENIAECCRIGTQKVDIGTDVYNYGLDCLFHDGRYQDGGNIGARMAGDIIWAGCKERVMDHMKATGSVGKNWIKIEN